MQSEIQMKRVDVNGVVTRSFTHYVFITLKILKTDFGLRWKFEIHERLE